MSLILFYVSPSLLRLLLYLLFHLLLFHLSLQGATRSFVGAGLPRSLRSEDLPRPQVLQAFRVRLASYSQRFAHEPSEGSCVRTWGSKDVFALAAVDQTARLEFAIGSKHFSALFSLVRGAVSQVSSGFPWRGCKRQEVREAVALRVQGATRSLLVGAWLPRSLRCEAKHPQ